MIDRYWYGVSSCVRLRVMLITSELNRKVLISPSQEHIRSQLAVGAVASLTAAPEEPIPLWTWVGSGNPTNWLTVLLTGIPDLASSVSLA